MPRVEWSDVERVARKVPLGHEEYGRILSVIENEDEGRRAYALGESFFKVLLLIDVGDLKYGDRVYLGKDVSKRPEGLRVKRRVKLRDLPPLAADRLRLTVDIIVKSNAEAFFHKVEIFFVCADRFSSTGTEESPFSPWGGDQYGPSPNLPQTHPLNRLGFSQEVVNKTIRGVRQKRIKSLGDVFRLVPDVTPKSLTDGICKWIVEELQSDPREKRKLFVSP